MNYASEYTDALVDLRQNARKASRWAESDALRDELLRRRVIVTDTANGQEVIYLSCRWTVEAYLKHQQEDRRAEARFEAWLFTQRSAISTHKRTDEKVHSPR